MRGARGRARGRGVRRALVAAVSPMLAAAVLTGCAQSTGSGGAAGTLTVYSGQHVQTTHALVAAFERESGVSVSLRSDDEDVLADQIVTEGSHSPADVYYTENSPPLQYLASKGLLAPVDPSTLATTPIEVQFARRQVGRRARHGSSVMAYNTSQLTPAQLPKSVMELARGQSAGRSAWPEARRTSNRSSRLASPGRRCRGAPLARGGQGDAGGHTYPAGDAHQQRRRGQALTRRHRPVLRSAAGPGRAGGLHSAVATSLRATSATSSTSTAPAS